ncbi:DNA primase [Roseomonas alkaliterrae]|uniref:DNA primase n=1 Tax=Neoroseomonas alkaliterrae TaxID=1452450 RepID=A0A840Y470_9PROT|nr:DNA primase [Neoroseomonas alkaliterrae]MBB5688963.1 DNA primase [Neoroseomonas alkaliterrae]MBR0674838.1 DNA primase [Neoroseomonas alkaliterrae]
MALPPAFLDELRARTPLPGLIGRKTRLVKSGRNWKGCCPFHGEKTPSFYVYDDHFHCFGCGAHGDAITFLMRAEGASFPEAVERLAAEAGMEVPRPSAEQAARERRARDLHAVMAAAAEAYHRRLFLPEGRPALDYLLRRGLKEETIRAFQLGWAPSGRGAIAADLRGEGVSEEQLIEAGLLRPGEAGDPPRDFFYARVMFPIRDRRGRVIAFGGRILGDGQPKYVNSPETPLFRKRMGLYGLDLAREGAFRGAQVVAVEGYMDVIALHQAGFTGAVAPLGTALTAEQLEELWRISPEPCLCFDGDAAGARAAARAAEVALPLISTERTLRFATLPAGEDPDTLTARRGPAAFQAVLDGARPMAEALYGLIAEGRPSATPEQRAALRNRLTGAAWAITDKALAAEYRRVLLDRFFAAFRGGRGGPAAPRRIARPAIAEPATRAERARMLLAILLRHPWLLPQVEEAVGLLDLPDGPPAQLRAAILAWHGGAERVDSEGLIAHLARCGLEDAVAWALAPAGLPLAARAEALPGEVEEGFWHFFLRLRGEADLIEDQQEARRILAETNDPAAQRRLILLTEALEAIRRGEAAAASGDAA